MSLALDYCNVMLPAFLPADADPYKMFWARSRDAQRQMFKHANSPLLLRRAVATGRIRAERAKAWARIDDEAAGALPRTARAPPPAPGPKPPPSIALLGVTHIGDPSATIFRPEAYPLDMDGCARKAPGGMLVVTRTSFGKFRMALMWDAVPFPSGLIEEFWRYVVDGVHEYVLEDASSKGRPRRWILSPMRR
jgi:hypothetical protein